jgi:NADH dehydrogenase
LQPVYVGDVAQAAGNAIDGQGKPGATYELGGPDQMTLRQAVEFVCRVTERRRILFPVPFGAASMMAGVSEFVDKITFGVLPPAMTTTRDEVALLRNDNVVSAEATAAGLTLAGLEVTAQSAEAIAPAYLHRFRKTGQYESNRFA